MPSNSHDLGEADLRRIAGWIRAGRLEDARQECAAAFSLGRPSDALLGLAIMLAMRSNDPAGGALHLEELIARHPGDRTARLRLAEAYIALGRFSRAVELCSVLSDNPAALRLTAYAEHQSGDLASARLSYETVVRHFPDDTDSWANFGNVHAALGDTDAAIAALEQAIMLRPSDARLYLNLAQVLEKADLNEARTRVLRSAAEVQPDDPEVQLALGLAEATLENFAEAEAAWELAISLAPGRPGAWLDLGMHFENCNRLEDLDRLIDRARPHLGPEIALLEAWSAFRHKDFDGADRHAKAMPDTLNAVRRYHLQGEIADRRGDAATAFNFYSRMNAEALAAAPKLAQGATYREIVVANTKIMRPLVTPRGVQIDDMPTPTFIVGFPRSGTTLLDTILGRLPATVVLEEQPLILAIERQIGGIGNVPMLNQAEVAAQRKAYRTQLMDLAPGAAGKRVIDKHPLHMARMPVIDTLFPRAPILFVERHPYDVVLSCFVSNFRLNHAMRSFTDLREAALTYDAVLSAWTCARAIYDLNVHVVRYERLVIDAEREIRDALHFLGEGYDEAILDTVTAVKERGRVRTASYAQVSEPIYQRSVARHERYSEQLEPVRSILAPWAERMGYNA